MNPLISSLTAFMLSFHALVGCGWHAAHACESRDASEPTALHASNCCDHEHNSPRPGAPDSHPCQGHFKCHRSCISLLPQKIQVDDMSHSLVVAIAPADGPGAGMLAHAPGDRSFGSDHAHAEPPVALHLLHQILLI